MSESRPSFLRGIQHVAVLCDPSPAGEGAAWRAALVARDLGVPLKLLLHRHDRADAALSPSTVALQSRITRQLGPPMAVQAVDGDTLAAVVNFTRDGLLVIPSVRRNPVRERIMGTQAERLIRLARGPVLVVKQPARAPYRRVFVAADLGPASDLLLDAGVRMSPRALITVVHALVPHEKPVLLELGAAPAVARDERMRQAARVRQTIEALACVPEREPLPDVKPVVVHGPAAPMIQSTAEAARAELVVVGKRRRGLLADFFLGSVTQQVLARVAADVLVVPLRETGSRSARRGQLTAPCCD